jgi:hypothetical protein
MLMQIDENGAPSVSTIDVLESENPITTAVLQNNGLIQNIFKV